MNWIDARIKDRTIKVLDHGYVRLIDWMGSDESIVEAARVSTGRGFVSWEPYWRCDLCQDVTTGGSPETEGPTTPRGSRACESSGFRSHNWTYFKRGDLGILDYLYRNRHTTPFEMCEIIIDVMVPMDCWRQWIRHRTASVNEYSTRYSEAIDLVAETASDKWRTQGKTNRQGSGEFLAVDDFTDAHGITYRGGYGAHLSQRERELHEHARDVYEERCAMGVAKEQARKDLPLSTYTAARWKCDLKNTLHFLGLRMHEHAQWEIRQYANAVAEFVKAIWPRTYALFEEYDLHGVRLSREEVKLVRSLLANVEGRGGAQAVYDKLRDKIGGPL